MPDHSYYTSYLLRVWRSMGETCCRASLENVATGERVGFASLAETAVILAQSGGDYNLEWNTMDGGGYTFSSGGDYSLSGTIGQPDAGTLSSGSLTLRRGFWRPACAAAAVAPAITRAGGTVTLTWTHNAANQAYQVHRATSPYFVPSAATGRAWVTAAPWRYTDPDAVVGDPGTNYFYLLRATCGAAQVDAQPAPTPRARPLRIARCAGLLPAQQRHDGAHCGLSRPAVAQHVHLDLLAHA